MKKADCYYNTKKKTDKIHLHVVQIGLHQDIGLHLDTADCMCTHCLW